MTRCLICGEPHTKGGTFYHSRCCKRLFGQSRSPQLPHDMDELNALAEKTVRRSIVVPGVQPKLSLHLEQTGKEGSRLTVIGWEGRYILKPPVSEYPEMPELEHLSMMLAQACGIATVPCGLIRLRSGEYTYITRRIDRENDHKLHMEDICQLSDRLTEQKYRSSMERAGKTILHYSSNPGLDALRFFDMALFSFIIGNADMHLKNFSLLHRQDGLIVLAPAYDLLATKLLLPEDREESALTINGKRNRLTLTDFVALGKNIRLNDKQIDNALARFRHAIPTALNRISSGFISPPLQEKLGELMRERVQRLLER